ncbi:MAG TPA: hypothetical protein VKL99_11670 [Candidatus Angelobacter sp.]|nr:hypothetical protein [Candidatus Angelobacter sp.]
MFGGAGEVREAIQACFCIDMEGTICAVAKAGFLLDGLNTRLNAALFYSGAGSLPSCPNNIGTGLCVSMLKTGLALVNLQERICSK